LLAHGLSCSALLPAYVIHSKLLPDRTDHIRGELDRAGIPFEWVLNFDPGEITPEVDRAYFVPGVNLTIRQQSCALTLDLYSHVLPGMQVDAVVRVDDALQAAINRGTKTIG
jgi:hypothetical protein